MNDYAFTAENITDVIMTLVSLSLLKINLGEDSMPFVCAPKGSAFQLISTDRPYLLLRRNQPLSENILTQLTPFITDDAPPFAGGDRVPE
ncbi:hypothetical protein ACMFFK_09835 [Serratia marcescens]|uniref:hypothetical protein n=1 Tax=Serratia marcescens TaxID=615 RepID=UPI000667F3CB|nr:hypothetical protein [Serratia marcescens]HAX9712042.1 hypothetical protein [Serratia marcescens]